MIIRYFFSIASKDSFTNLINASSSINPFSRIGILKYFALASLRIDIERKLREVAKRKELKREYCLGTILQELASRKIIGSSERKILEIIIDVCNRAVHAEKVDALTAFKILDLGIWMLSYLDSLQ